jgi:hypothetical protein
MESGIGTPILEDNRPLIYIEWGWIPSIQDFLLHINSQIINATNRPLLYRQHDSYLMDAQILPQLTRKEQILINRCRLFLQVERLSDISSADRTTILDDWKQANDHTSSRSAKSWTSQGNPGEEAWKIWRLFLDRAFLTNGKLRQNLGKWIQFNPDRIFYARYQESTKTLWHYLNDNKWTSHKLIQSDRRSMLFSNKHESSMPYPPIDSTPIDILSQTDQEIITSPGTQMSNNTAQTQAPSTSLQTRLKLRESDPLFHDIRITVPKRGYSSTIAKYGNIQCGDRRKLQ